MIRTPTNTEKNHRTTQDEAVNLRERYTNSKRLLRTFADENISARPSEINDRVSVTQGISEERKCRQFMRQITAALLLLLSLGVQVVSAQRPIRVHVLPVTTTEGFTDAESKRRSDSRLDLIKNLASEKRLQLVDEATSADVVLELLASSRAATGELRTETTAKPAILGRGAYSTTTPNTQPTVIVKLTAGTYETEITGTYDSLRWRDAANAAGRQIKQWIKDNQQRLLAKDEEARKAGRGGN